MIQMSIPWFACCPPIIFNLALLSFVSAYTWSNRYNSLRNKQHNEKLNILILQLEIDTLIYDFVKYTFVYDVNIVWHLILRFTSIILLQHFISKLSINKEVRVWVLGSRDQAPRLDMITWATKDWISRSSLSNKPQHQASESSLSAKPQRQVSGSSLSINP